jgi:hypothetical protein
MLNTEEAYTTPAPVKNKRNRVPLGQTVMKGARYAAGSPNEGKQKLLFLRKNLLLRKEGGKKGCSETGN